MDIIEKNKDNTNRHPWERSRVSSLLNFIKYNPKNTQYLDVGAGDQYFAHHVSLTTNLPIIVVDQVYRENLQNQKIIQYQELISIPDDTADFVFLLDVLEHVEHTDIFLDELLPKVKKNGKFLITVPAYQFLFSSHDIFLKHHRRYNYKSLRDLVTKHDMHIEESFSFYTSLFFLRLAEKLLGKVKKIKNKGVGTWRFPCNHLVTKIIVGFLNIDFKLGYLIQKSGLPLPGLSLCMICRKKHC